MNDSRQKCLIVSYNPSLNETLVFNSKGVFAYSEHKVNYTDWATIGRCLHEVSKRLEIMLHDK